MRCDGGENGDGGTGVLWSRLYLRREAIDKNKLHHSKINCKDHTRPKVHQCARQVVLELNPRQSAIISLSVPSGAVLPHTHTHIKTYVGQATHAAAGNISLPTTLSTCVRYTSIVPAMTRALACRV